MATYTIDANIEFEAFILNVGYTTADIIEIQSGATLLVLRTPSVLVGTINVNYGMIHIDGTNINLGNNINFLGEGGLIDGTNDQRIVAFGQGTVKVTGGWYSLGTTTGIANQSIDVSTYWDNFGISSIPMVQVETGRRINYTAGLGIAPEIGNFVYKTSDASIMGKIKEVGVDYIIVWLLTGSLVDLDAIVIRSVVDNFGPDMQRSWTAVVNGADIKEIGVYTEFGNAVADGIGYSSSFGSGLGGMVFDNLFGASTLTLGNGFLPPIGCDIRVPNVNINTSTQAQYLLGYAYSDPLNIEPLFMYRITTNSGSVFMDSCNLGNSIFLTSGAFNVKLTNVGAIVSVGSSLVATMSIIDHCVLVQSSNTKQYVGNTFGNMSLSPNGMLMTHCLMVAPLLSRASMGSESSKDVTLKDNIYTSAGLEPALYANGSGGYSVVNSINTRVQNNMYFGNDHAKNGNSIYCVHSRNNLVEDFYVSMTQEAIPQTYEKDSLYFQNTSDTVIVGVSVIGNGVPGNDLIRFIHSSRIKVRAIGMIDEKLDMGLDGEYIVHISGLGEEIDISRVWKTGGIIEEVVLGALSTTKILVQNCSGKYASILNPIASDNIRYKGVHGGSGGINSTSGWKSTYLRSYGYSFHDGFQSDTNGTIACLMITPSSTINESKIISGNPLFYKNGNLDMHLGDIIEFTQGYFTKGHSGFTGLYTSFSGEAAKEDNELVNITILFQYQLEGGTWSGTWLDLRTPVNLTSISGEIEAGIKFKLRFEATGIEKAISGVLIDTTTSLAVQTANLYPIDQIEATLSLVGHPINSTVLLYDLDSVDPQDLGTELVRFNTAAETVSYTYQGTKAGDIVQIKVLKTGYITLTKQYTLPANDNTFDTTLKAETN